MDLANFMSISDGTKCVMTGPNKVQSKPRERPNVTALLKPHFTDNSWKRVLRFKLHMSDTILEREISN